MTVQYFIIYRAFDLTLCMLSNFTCFLSSADFLINFFEKKSFRNTIKVSNNLDPDQARRFVWYDLGPKSLQKLSANNKNCH